MVTIVTGGSSAINGKDGITLTDMALGRVGSFHSVTKKWRTVNGVKVVPSRAKIRRNYSIFVHII